MFEMNISGSGAHAKSLFKKDSLGPMPQLGMGLRIVQPAQKMRPIGQEIRKALLGSLSLATNYRGTSSMTPSKTTNGTTMIGTGILRATFPFNASSLDTTDDE